MARYEGNSEGNTLNGAGQSDLMFGYGGDDVIFGGGADDFIYGGAGNDLLHGDAGIWGNRLYGGSGNDELFGGPNGAHTLFGGDGDDIFDPGSFVNGRTVDAPPPNTFNEPPQVYGGAGNDTVILPFASTDVTVDWISGNGLRLTTIEDYAGGFKGMVRTDEVELFAFTDQTLGLAEVQVLHNVTLAGTEAGETLTGGIGDDVIDGLGGDDRLFGGDGDDDLRGGEGNDILDGGTGRNTLFGGAGKDELYGYGTGTLFGGEGNDTFHWINRASTIEETLGYSEGGGIDTLIAYTGETTLPSNVEVLRLYGDAVTGRGNWAPEVLVGNALDNTLYGSGGNDRIVANGGNDTLIGGRGRDTLVGGDGADIFAYETALDSGVGYGIRDFINGFVRGEDLIDLSGIDADTTQAGGQAFAFVTRFDGTPGQVSHASYGGNWTIVSADTDGDALADFQIFVNLTDVMSASDFIL